MLSGLEQRGNIPELSQGLLSLGNLLLEDMHHEEEECLQPDLLHDDNNVLVDQQTD